jgi:uncharacterized protein YrrD
MIAKLDNNRSIFVFGQSVEAPNDRNKPKVYNYPMYAMASQMEALPVISLQTGEAVAEACQPIIDIASLEILAFQCESSQRRRPVVLMARDVRQLASDCIIIDNEDELANPEDIVRLQSMIALSYNPLEKPVVSDTGRKLGNVDDYTINLETNRIQKLHVRQSMFRSWLGATLIIDRTQIIEITAKKITVRDSTVKANLMQSEPIPETPS